MKDDNMEAHIKPATLPITGQNVAGITYGHIEPGIVPITGQNVFLVHTASELALALAQQEKPVVLENEELATPAPVERHDTRGAYVEVLDLTGARLPDRAPLLDAHNRDSVDRVLGHVEALRVEGGQLRGRAVLSRHNPAAIRLAGELTDGARFAVSVGYHVGTWRDGTDGTTRTRTATAWDLLEASLVPVGADPDAGTRGTEHMTTPTTGTRAETNAAIRQIATTASLDRAWSDALIDREATVEQARAEAFDAMHQRGTATAGILTATHTRELDDREGRRAAMSEALFARVTPSHRPSERAWQYVGMTIPDLARECLRAAGVSTTALSAATVVERAGMHTTSDFAIMLGDTVGRTLRAAYTAAPSALRLLAQQRTATDFRMQHRLSLSAGGFTLLKVNEAGEFREGTLVEGGEAYKVETFGRIFSISRQALVNDSLGAFSDLPRTLGTAAAALEADVIASLITSNPLMSDGERVFSAAHGNLVTPGAIIDLDTLTEARVLMRRQTGPGGELLNVTPRFLVVPPELETVAEQYVAALAAAEPANVNPLAGRLTVVTDPRLTDDTAWYVVGDGEGLEVALLEGEDGPNVSGRIVGRRGARRVADKRVAARHGC